MASVKVNLSLPTFNFQEDLRIAAERIFIPEMEKNIVNQVQINGGAYPALEPETIKRKTGQASARVFTKSGKLRETASKAISRVGLRGFSTKTLIQTGDLLSSFIFMNKGKTSVQITLDSSRKKIGEYLQIQGVGHKHKKFIFFGVSNKMETDVMAYMKNKVADTLNAKN